MIYIFEIKKHIKKTKQCFVRACVVRVWWEVFAIEVWRYVIREMLAWWCMYIMCCEKCDVCIVTVCLISSQMLDPLHILIQFPYIIPHKFSNRLKEAALWTKEPCWFTQSYDIHASQLSYLHTSVIVCSILEIPPYFDSTCLWYVV